MKVHAPAASRAARKSYASQGLHHQPAFPVPPATAREPGGGPLIWPCAGFPHETPDPRVVARPLISSPSFGALRTYISTDWQRLLLLGHHPGGRR